MLPKRSLGKIWGIVRMNTVSVMHLILKESYYWWRWVVSVGNAEMQRSAGAGLGFGLSQNWSCGQFEGHRNVALEARMEYKAADLTQFRVGLMLETVNNVRWGAIRCSWMTLRILCLMFPLPASENNHQICNRWRMIVRWWKFQQWAA